MSETIAIILRFREEHADAFERLFVSSTATSAGIQGIIDP